MKRLRPWLIGGVALLALAAAGWLLWDRARPGVSHATLPASSPVSPTSGPSVEVYFDDTDANRIVLGNAYYEVGLLKSNGGIAYILDKASGERVSQGSPDGCLWKLAFSFSPSGLTSCARDLAFQYDWSEADRRLILRYTAAPSESKQAVVTVTLSASSQRWFDLQLRLDNRWGYTSGDVQFPAGLLFEREALQEALLPVLPGVVLEERFFQQQRSYQAAYPGWPGVFADFVALTGRQGALAMYSTSGESGLTPALFGFDQGDCGSRSLVCLTHAFQPRVPNGQSWTSPRVRVLVSAEREALIEQFREDDGLAAAESLRDKLGERFERVARSPLYKADSAQLGLAYSDYPALLARLPEPGLLHVVAYSPGGFDRNYPDMLPPDPRWGSTAEMATLFGEAQALGFVVMPYTNPTWWDEQSPTLRDLPAGTGLAAVTAVTELGGQYEECYGCPADPHYGYVVSPFADLVRQRLEALLRQMTEEVPSDLVFEDQIGARPALFDYNPASPTPDAYIQGWVEHAQTYRAARLATEDGFDRLVPYEVGFHGSTRLSEVRGDTDSWWGARNWHYYPLAGMLAGDKVFFYQHNLAPESFTHNLATLSWNAAMGYMLSYDLYSSNLGGGIGNDWIAVAAEFQHYVLGEYAGERILGYTQLAEKVTRTDTAHFSVTTNWALQDPYVGADYVLPAQGLLIQKDDGSLLAGVFTTYHGLELEHGAHYLIEQRGADAITIRQPFGRETRLALVGLDGWTAATSLEAQAYTRAGEFIGSAPVSFDGKLVTFTYQGNLAGQAVAYYTLAPAQP